MKKRSHKRPSRTRKTVRGGWYIGEGAYGCTFTDPPLKCTTNATRRNRNQLTKLMDPIFAKEEYNQSNILRKIDPTEQYFLTANHSCTLNTTNIKPANQLDKCKVIKNITTRKSLLFYKFGGYDLSTFTVLMPELYTLLFTSCVNLINGLQLAHDNHIVHHDIKAQNIVTGNSLDGLSLLTRYIDFGLAIQFPITSFRLKYDLEQEFKKIYVFWPFDIRFLNGAYLDDTINNQEFRTKTVEQEYVDWHTQYIKYYPDYAPLFVKEDGSPRISFTDYMNYIVENYHTKQTIYTMESVLQAADRYALGLVYIYFLRFLQYSIVWAPDGTVNFIITNSKKLPGGKGFVTMLDQYGIPADVAKWHREVEAHIARPLYNIIEGFCKYDPMNRITLRKAKQIFAVFIQPHIDRLLEPSLVYRGLSVVKPIRGFQLQPVSPIPPQPPIKTGAVPVIAPPSVSPKGKSLSALPKSRRHNHHTRSRS